MKFNAFSGPAEWGVLPGTVSVISETFIMYRPKENSSPGGFKSRIKVKSRWFQKRSAGPDSGESMGFEKQKIS